MARRRALWEVFDVNRDVGNVTIMGHVKRRKFDANLADFRPPSGEVITIFTT